MKLTQEKIAEINEAVTRNKNKNELERQEIIITYVKEVLTSDIKRSKEEISYYIMSTGRCYNVKTDVSDEVIDILEQMNYEFSEDSEAVEKEDSSQTPSLFLITFTAIIGGFIGCVIVSAIKSLF